MKKNLLVLLIIPLMLLSGCSSKENEKEKDPMLSLCDKVDNIVQNYRDESINKDEFISQVLELESECTTDDYLCTQIAAFKILNSDLKQEIFDAYASELNRDCQFIRDRLEK